MPARSALPHIFPARSSRNRFSRSTLPTSPRLLVERPMPPSPRRKNSLLHKKPLNQSPPRNRLRHPNLPRSLHQPWLLRRLTSPIRQLPHPRKLQPQPPLSRSKVCQSKVIQPKFPLARLPSQSMSLLQQHQFNLKSPSLPRRLNSSKFPPHAYQKDRSRRVTAAKRTRRTPQRRYVAPLGPQQSLPRNGRHLRPCRRCRPRRVQSCPARRTLFRSRSIHRLVTNHHRSP